METIVNTIIGADGKQYLKSELTDLCYNIDTPIKIIGIIDNAYKNKTRLVLDYGDIKTGKSWGETYDIKGTIGRSTGSIKIPLLIHNKRSIGGGSILTHCLVKISESKGGREIYKHLNYHAV